MTKNRASALLLTTILLFVILSMAVSLTYVTVMEQKISSKTKSSVGSFFSAESGVEWALNKIATATGTNPTVLNAFPGFSGSKVPCPTGFNCEIYFLDQNGSVITDSATLLSDVEAVRSVGSQGNQTQRAIEAAVAAGGKPIFTKCQVKASSTAVYPTCPTGFTDIHHYASEVIHYYNGFGGGVYTQNVEDSTWRYSTDCGSMCYSVLACTVCQQN